MCLIARRRLVIGCIASVVGTGTRARAEGVEYDIDPKHRQFIAAAEEMRLRAVRSGDEAYGAVVVAGGQIIGWGPSRVVIERNVQAHAERVAIRDALQVVAGRITGAVIYSTSRPCRDCEKAAAAAGVTRMFWGLRANDAGAPRS